MDGVRRSRPSITSMLAIALNALQVLCAIILLGLIGVRFTRITFSSAVYSIIISVLTILTGAALGFLSLRPPTRRFIILASLGWQAVFVILWAAVAGVMGRYNNNTLRAALALSLIEMLLFLVGTVIVGLSLWRGRRAERKIVGGV